MARIVEVSGGEDPIGGVEAGEVSIFEAHDVVVADQVQVRSLYGIEQIVSEQMECRVPELVLEDFPIAEVAVEIGMALFRAEEDGSALLTGDGQGGNVFREQVDVGSIVRFAQ